MLQSIRLWLLTRWYQKHWQVNRERTTLRAPPNGFIFGVKHYSPRSSGSLTDATSTHILRGAGYHCTQPE